MPIQTVTVTPITDPSDFTAFFTISASAFGSQARDGVWMAMNPGWNTAEGKQKGVERLIQRWSSTTRNRTGDPNTVFLKATMSSPSANSEVIVGVAILAQASMLDGHGDVPLDIDAAAVYPGDPTEQRYLLQLDRSLHRRRVAVVEEIACSPSPAVMVLDLCVVDPAFQRKGVATKLVQWGLDEARRRGGLEAVLEASSMGRHVYGQLGFVQDGGECEYVVDEQFKGREQPSNIFMRTGRPE
ncbi:GNAT family N-acetyltransferase [Aspergillus mulundensis]|uniref:N-acetyltransferase domain-containing protein n=1 Tax=Aspergillus mulundensis TaxID=1810919 RepID=A0A3D8T2P2_9EURO|nr:Uncharacterized protein DSM5745_00136 [Aspergillus mulundensis]RDW92814.1 Uncharacterized protein DSM5745_00136 [Aspergillus mulundensis]